MRRNREPAAKRVAHRSVVVAQRPPPEPSAECSRVRPRYARPLANSSINGTAGDLR